MSDLITNLEDLGPEELKAVSNLINKLAKRKRSEEPLDNLGEVEETVERKPKQKQKPTVQGRSSPRNPQNQKKDTRVRRRGGSRGGAGRTESVVLSNENKFEKMRERNNFKADAEIDKKLWGDRKPTERPDEFEFVEVQCKECGKWYDINPNLVYIDQDSREVNFTCDNCVPRGN